MIERLRSEGGGPRGNALLPPRRDPAAPRPAVEPQLPDNTSVVITREGDKPAKIVVKQGEQKWEITEDEINKLPESLRPAVEQMLGRGNVTFAIAGPADDRARSGRRPAWKSGSTNSAARSINSARRWSRRAGPPREAPRRPARRHRRRRKAARPAAAAGGLAEPRSGDLKPP